MGEITNFKGETQSRSALSPAEQEAAALIARVGERAREARERTGMPRRVLSEKSGVSPRYLAQLEAGEGNISIGLLQRVASALDLKVEWLIGADDPWTSDAFRVAQLFRESTADVQSKVLELLGSEAGGAKRAHRICLLGMRGAGKSTLGSMAAEALKMPFLELNKEIEEHSGMPVDEVMALYGQEGYRALEARAVRRIIEAHDSLFLAVAGGIVVEPETYNLVLANFHTIWVRTTPEEHMRRVRAQGDLRPMAGNPEAMEQLRSILGSREALYEKAQARLDTTDRSKQESLADLLALIEDKGFLA